MLFRSAVFFWIGSFIPFVNWLIEPAGWAAFFFWFRITGGGLIKEPGSKGFVSSLILRILSFLIGFVPDIGTLLSLFPVVIYTNIRRIQKEDADFNASQMKNM